ncbi:MAG: HD domain-containing phosphohydrolase [Psychrilyobacter sp.]|uniref:HD domain-containing phosphohydrolase n=1 Tax=Psychrilyobacter sp. TaxID=2586924 RepID=UPI003C7873B9
MKSKYKHYVLSAILVFLILVSFLAINLAVQTMINKNQSHYENSISNILFCSFFIFLLVGGIIFIIINGKLKLEKEKIIDELITTKKSLDFLNKKNLNNLKKVESIFENIILNLPIPIMIHAEDGTILSISQNWTELTQYNKSDIPTIFEWTKKVYGKNKDEVCDFIRKLYKLRETRHNGEFSVTTKDGRELIWDFNSGYIGNLSDGRAVAISIATDVTERLSREQENIILIKKIRNTETLLKASLESPKDMVILSIDKKYNYNYFNQNHKESMLKVYGAKITVGSNLLDQIIVKEDRIKAKTNYKKALRGESYNIIEVYGEENKVFFESYFYPIYDTNNLVIGASVFSRDITVRILEEQLLKESFDRLDRSQKIANVGSWEVDLDTNLIWGSKEAFEIYELPRESEYIELAKIQKKLIPEEKEMMDDALINLIQNGSSYEVNFTLNTKTKTKNIHSKAFITKNSLGKANKVLGVIRDITEINITNQKQKESEKQYRLLANMMPLGMIHYQFFRDSEKSITDFRILWVNKALEQLIGMKNSELVGKNLCEIFIEMEQYWIDIFQEVASSGKTKIFENYSIAIDGYIKITVYKIETDRMAVIIEDVSEDRKKKKEIMHISYHDSLTDLYNRRYYEDNLSKLDIPKNYPLTIVMSDINGLKLINDAFGHSAGDELLISAANLILGSCRETDLIARIGGDEFVIVMPNTNGKEAEKIIEKINKEAEKIIIESIELSISFGFDTKNEVNEDINEIYKSAEDLMYREKLLVIPSMRSGAIETIMNTLNEKDNSSEIHSRIVSNISEKIALAYGMDRQDIAEVKTAGLLHDIGKIMIPISIITKEGKLTTEEYDLIKGHPEIGFRILNSTHDMRNISNIVLNHHERWDGMGYPRGIKAEKIPLQSRIISIADTFDAMTSKRTYQKICTNKEALDEIIRCSGTQFDPELVQIFIDNFNTIIEVKHFV